LNSSYSALAEIAAPESTTARSHTRELREALAKLSLTNAQQVASALAQLERQQWLELPLPGSGATHARFAALIEIGAADLSLARLAEGHSDARAILAELNSRPKPGLYGVWAADPPAGGLGAQRILGGYRLRGCKRYASGAGSLARALVTARSPQGICMFDLDLTASGLRRIGGSWSAVGMADSNSLDVDFDDVFVSDRDLVGAPGAYLNRAGFWHGAVGVAACWLGGAVGCARMLHERFAHALPDEHAAAHIGAVAASCHAMQAVLANAAAAIDRDALDCAGAGRQRALLVRSIIERGCEDVLSHAGKASGSSPLVFELQHARRAADLPVYLRQHHAERDLAALGHSVLEGASCP
jgi:alkylation response protein AidB-like acyl-CoA dehydrogenase